MFAKKENRWDWPTLIGLIVLGAVIGRTQTNSFKAGSVSPIESALLGLESPWQRLFNGTANYTSDFCSGVFSAAKLRNENAVLKRQLQAMSLYTETVDQLHKQVDSLRALQDMPALPGKTKIFTEVIAYFPSENRMTLRSGSRDGLRKGQPVVTAAGLVGVIQSTTPQSSIVTLLSAPPPFTIGALVASRNPSPAGLLRGEGSNTLLLQFDDPKAPVENGDLIITSGFSEQIPRGIPIGRVIQVMDDVEFGRRQAKVFPSVSIGEVREVVVLK